MNSEIVEKIVKKIRKELQQTGEYGKKHSGDYYSPFWNKKLDAIFNECKIHICERRKIGNAVIQKINEEIEKNKELNQEKKPEIIIDEEKIIKESERAVPAEIGDISGNDLYERTDGQCGFKSKPSHEFSGENHSKETPSENGSKSHNLFPPGGLR
jgi:hypothetical protein